MSLSKPWRPYQREADEHISFTIENKRLVKMFCGTGKSLLMRYGRAFQGHSLCVYVFPSLSLIEQFNTDYLTEPTVPYLPHNVSIPTGIMIISSEDDHTTKETRDQGVRHPTGPFPVSPVPALAGEVVHRYRL